MLQVLRKFKIRHEVNKCVMGKHINYHDTEGDFWILNCFSDIIDVL